MSIFERIYLSVAMLQVRRGEGDKGAAMVEYAILVAGMALVVAAAVLLLGSKIDGFISGMSI